MEKSAESESGKLETHRTGVDWAREELVFGRVK